MSAEDDLIHVINRTAVIESMLNEAIRIYCSPRKDAIPFFRQVILDSSIITLGSKIRVASAIAQIIGFKLDHRSQNSLHQLIACRNAFAHNAVDAHPTILVGENPEQDQVQYMFYKITNSGNIERKSRDQVLKEFDTYYDQVIQPLEEFIRAIVANVENE